MEINTIEVLKRIENLEREAEYIKRDLLHIEEKQTMKPSLFGSVSGGDITCGMIEKAKQDLFRELEDI